MPRIEQLANGSYVRRTNHLEDQIIKRLYKEIADRETQVSALMVRVDTLETQMTTALTEIANLKLRVQSLESKHV